MRTSFLFVLLLCAATALPLLNPTHEAATITPSEVVSGLLIWPAIMISLVGLLMGIAFLFAGRKNWLMGLGYICLGAVLPLGIVSKKKRFESAFDQQYAWFNQTQGGGTLNFYLHRIIEMNPQAVSYIGSTEEVQVEGLFELMQKDFPIYLHDSSGRKREFLTDGKTIKTPWGALIHFAVDRDGDGYVSVENQKSSTRYGVANPWTYDPSYKYSRATGVFVNLPDTVLGNVDSSLVTLDNNDYQRLKETQEWSVSYDHR